MNNTYSGSNAYNALKRGPILQYTATFETASTCSPTADTNVPYHRQYFNADILIEKIVVTVKPGSGSNMYIYGTSWKDYSLGIWKPICFETKLDINKVAEYTCG
jgi:hypothetical protein